MNKLKLLKGACLVAASAMLPLSQAAMADVTISGWINQGVTFIDDGVGSDVIPNADNGNTLGSRITFSASHDLPNSGLNAGMEVIIEILESGQLGIGTGAGPGGIGEQNIGGFDNWSGNVLNALSHNVFIGGGWGKLTVGLQSMPTDNIAVLEDPSLTLWSSISPVFRGNGVFLQNDGPGITGASGDTGVSTNSTWGDFMNCYTAPHLRHALGIGIDCNGTYQTGIRYDLPAFGPVTIAVGYANDDVYDIAAKWKGSLGRIKANIALGYVINQGIQGVTYEPLAGTFWEEAENFQLQAGLMDPESGLFGSIAYQHEEADLIGAAVATGASPLSDDTDAYWLKVGIKKQWFGVGDTTVAFQYGSYNDQYGIAEATAGVRGSELERIGVEVNQYFGSSLILYGVWENLSVDADCTAITAATTCASINGADDLDTFTLGAVYFF